MFFYIVKLMKMFVQPKKKKNISTDAFGSVLGRIHMQKQDLNKLQTRKLNAFKRSRSTTAEENNGSDNKKLKTE